MSLTENDATRVLVTGGSGFIGRPLVRQLVERGSEVHIVAADAVTADVQAHFHEVDLLNAVERQRVITDVAAGSLIHLAWFVKPGQVWNSIENVRWVEASLGLLRDFAATGGRRGVLAGTCSEYGPESGLCHEETTALAPSNLYGVCKDALRAIALAAAPQLGVSLVWARIFMAYGPGEHPVRLVSSVINHLLRGEPAPISHGRQVRDFLSTDEIGSALIAALFSDVEGPVNVASGRPITLREVVETVADELDGHGLVRYGEVDPPPDDPPFQVADTTRLVGEVGWRPTETLREGIVRTIRWWEDELKQRGELS